MIKFNQVNGSVAGSTAMLLDLHKDNNNDCDRGDDNGNDDDGGGGLRLWCE